MVVPVRVQPAVAVLPLCVRDAQVPGQISEQQAAQQAHHPGEPLRFTLACRTPERVSGGSSFRFKRTQADFTVHTWRVAPKVAPSEPARGTKLARESLTEFFRKRRFFLFLYFISPRGKKVSSSRAAVKRAPAASSVHLWQVAPAAAP